MSRPLGCQHEAFDIPDAVAYLNAAYMGPLSKRVVAAGHAGLERKMQPWTITAPDFFEPVEDVRRLFALLIGADADGVAVIPAVSYGVAIAAQNLAFASGNNIVVLAEQFPSNIYSWRDLAERKEGTVVTVPRPSDGDWTRAVLEHIDDRTAICAIETCHWTDGGLIDVVRVAERTREVGAALVVDGTQSVGALPFDTERVQPDFLITAAYKWLLAPYGAALMWCAPEHRQGRPLEFSWITRRDSGDFARLVDYDRDLREGARRYDVGQTSSFAMISALRAAIQQTLDWGVERISAYTGRLGELIAQRAEAAGLRVAPIHLRAPHLLGVHLSGVDTVSIAAALADANVHVSVRGEAMRVSPHVYNDDEDLDRLFEALKAAL